MYTSRLLLVMTSEPSSSSGRGGSGELGERSRSGTEGLLCIQARQIGYNGVFSLNWAKSTLRSNSLITYVSGGEGKGEKSEPLYSGWLYAHLPSQSSEYSLDL